MKQKWFAGFLTVAIIMSFPCASLYGLPEVVPAPETPPATKQYSWSEKLKRGALNIVTSPVEIARSIQTTSQEKNLLNGWTIGLVKGLGDGVVRFGAGAIDALTCPFNFPNKRKEPLIQPEYVWEKPGVKYS